uniref:Ion_trans_2 domain-containing protein n=2 Tax=Bursaphelenchus xylophilus TaxID=6326 RepID=A0A1I7SHY2_BURXY
VRRQSRRLSHFRRKNSASPSAQSTGTAATEKAGSMNLNDLRDPNSLDEEDEEFVDENKQPLRIPILMVLVVILSYTALGGLLFQKFEEWPYMEAFYFCFITMATIGFGDYVPTKQMYIVITLCYIIFGLALATMCIDTAGTHYIRKIHYVGTKMEDAKGAVMTGIHHSEHLLKHKGIKIIKTAGGKIYRVRSRLLSKEQLDYILKSSQYQQKNIIYEPLSPKVTKLVREKNIHILPDDISESECRGGLFNPDYEKKYMKTFFSYAERSPNRIKREMVPRDSLTEKNASTVSLVAPFVLKESNI